MSLTFEMDFEAATNECEPNRIPYIRMRRMSASEIPEGTIIATADPPRRRGGRPKKLPAYSADYVPSPVPRANGPAERRLTNKPTRKPKPKVNLDLQEDYCDFEESPKVQKYSASGRPKRNVKQKTFDLDDELGSDNLLTDNSNFSDELLADYADSPGGHERVKKKLKKKKKTPSKVDGRSKGIVPTSLTAKRIKNRIVYTMSSSDDTDLSEGSDFDEEKLARRLPSNIEMRDMEMFKIIRSKYQKISQLYKQNEKLRTKLSNAKRIKRELLAKSIMKPTTPALSKSSCKVSSTTVNQTTSVGKSKASKGTQRVILLGDHGQQLLLDVPSSMDVSSLKGSQVVDLNNQDQVKAVIDTLPEAEVVSDNDSGRMWDGDETGDYQPTEDDIKRLRKEGLEKPLPQKLPKYQEQAAQSQVPIKKIKCEREGCGAEFNLIPQLTRHMRVVHNEEPIYKCRHDNCGKTFKNSMARKNHETIHTGEMPYMCAQCGKQFRLKEKMEFHEKAVHTAEEDKKFACEHCDKRFSVRPYLTAHLRTHDPEREAKRLAQEAKRRNNPNWKPRKSTSKKRKKKADEDDETEEEEQDEDETVAAVDHLEQLQHEVEYGFDDVENQLRMQQENSDIVVAALASMSQQQQNMQVAEQPVVPPPQNTQYVNLQQAENLTPAQQKTFVQKQRIRDYHRSFLNGQPAQASASHQVPVNHHHQTNNQSQQNIQHFANSVRGSNMAMATAANSVINANTISPIRNHQTLSHTPTTPSRGLSMPNVATFGFDHLAQLAAEGVSYFPVNMTIDGSNVTAFQPQYYQHHHH